MRKKETVEDNSRLFVQSVEDVLHNSMLPYSEYVILDRALPRVEDGLKPVQRRILYAMSELGLTPDKPHKKSARIVGECLGKFHPHGDSSVYDAMVRLAQPFNMRMTLVDGHGNFGSNDGDGAAAMRYTEARLAPLAMYMLQDLEKDTVPWQWNFDDSLKEPTLLPSKYPNLLVNGANGIAVGFSTNIPTHNLGEVIDGAVAMLENPRITLDEIMKYIPAPDFPTGGIIVAGDDLRRAYECGKGKITIRARIHIEDGEYDKKNIVITELPYQVEKADLLQKILALREDKKDILAGISDIVDESDRNGMRAVIKVRKDADASQIVRYLLKYTKLETGFSINMVAIADGKPRLMGLSDMLRYYVDFQRDVLVKRCSFDLKAAKIRAEIVEGLLIAIKNIDEVIRIIKQSKNPSAAAESLRARFGLSDRQAQAILEMKLRRLTGLDVETLKNELAELRKKIEELTAIINSKRKQNSVLIADLNAVKKQFKDGRRSEIKYDDGKKEIEIPFQSDETAYKEGVIVLNTNGCLKFVQTRGFAQSQRRAGDTNCDSVVRRAIFVNNRQKLVAFTDAGNCYKLNIDDVPEKRWREKGASPAALSKDAESKEKFVSIFASDTFPIGEVLMFTKGGNVKRTSWDDLNVAKNSFKVINLSHDELLNVETVAEGQNIFTATAGGLSLLYEIDEVPLQGRNAAGVHGIQLNKGDCVVFAGQISDEGELIVVSDRSFAKRVFAFSFELSKRYRKGVKLMDMPDKHKIALVDYVKEPYDIALFDADGNAKGFSTEDVDIGARTTRGKQLIKGNGVYSCFRHNPDYEKPINA